MYIWLNLRIMKFYLIKLATEIHWQSSYLLSETASLKPIDGSTETVKKSIKLKEMQFCQNFHSYKIGKVF